MKTKVWRQGDVVIAREKVPAQAKEIEHDGVLAYGEVTGHKHQLVGGGVKYFRDDKGALFFRVSSRFVDLNHGGQPAVKSDGHFAHRLPAGSYRVLHQREADWLEEVTRNVED